MIDDPLCIVMEMLPGRIDSATIADAAQQRKVREDFMAIIARVHALPINAFDAVRLPVPRTAEEIALNLYAPSQAIFAERIGGRPWPLMEFAWSWLTRNVPKDRDRLSFVNFDGGQFLFDDAGHVTGLIDFEVSSLGDPAAELSGMRLRDSTEKLGDLTALVRHYETLTGDTISRKLIEFHTAGFCGVNGFLMWPLMFDSAPEQDFVAYQHYCVATSRWMISAMAAHDDVLLEDPPGPTRDPLGFAQASRHLVRHVKAMPCGDAAADYQRDSVAAQALHLGRVNDYGQSVRAAHIADIESLTGETPADWEAAQAGLSRWIVEHGGEPGTDAALIRLFHHWLKRQSFLLEGCGQAAYLTEVDLQPILDD
ncbi:phosphotransferase [Sphingobium baderi]|nr:phosphotransferase [Sphingobium baderi]